MSEFEAKAIKKALCDLTVVEENAFGFEIALAQIYSNAEAVVVTIERDQNGFLVHDAGNGAMVLELSGVTTSARLHEHLRNGVSAYDCELKQFRVQKFCAHPNEVASTAAIVGCASRLVADFSHQAETTPMFDFRRQLIESLYEVIGSPRVRENDEIIARTGSRYQVSATVLDQRGSKPIAYIEAISGHQSVARKFRALYDLQHTPLISDTRRIAIFDDSRAGITTGDIALLREVSDPVPFRDSNQIIGAWSTIQ